jgi:hypothetical protein
VVIPARTCGLPAVLAIIVGLGALATLASANDRGLGGPLLALYVGVGGVMVGAAWHRRDHAFASILCALLLYTATPSLAALSVPGAFSSTPPHLIPSPSQVPGFLSFCVLSLLVGVVGYYAFRPLIRRPTQGHRSQPASLDVRRPLTLVAPAVFSLTAAAAWLAVSRSNDLSYFNNDGVKNDRLALYALYALPIWSAVWLVAASRARGASRAVFVSMWFAATATAVTVGLMVSARNHLLALVIVHLGYTASRLVTQAGRVEQARFRSTRWRMAFGVVLAGLVAASALGSVRIARGTVDTNLWQAFVSGQGLSELSSLERLLDQDYRHPALVLYSEQQATQRGPGPVIDQRSALRYLVVGSIPLMAGANPAHLFTAHHDADRASRSETFAYLILTDGWALFGWHGFILNGVLLAAGGLVLQKLIAAFSPSMGILPLLAVMASVIPIVRAPIGSAIAFVLQYLVVILVLSWPLFATTSRRHRSIPGGVPCLTSC